MELDMKKDNNRNSINVIVVNPPTKEQANKRIKKLALYLASVWTNPKNTG